MKSSCDRLLGHLVVVAAGAGEAHDVPVVEELDAFARHEVGADHRQARRRGDELAVAQLERAAADPRRVRAAAPEAVAARTPRSRRRLADARGAARRELPRGHRDAGAVEHRGHRGGAGVRARERRGRGVGEQAPARGAVGATHLLVHRDDGRQVGLLAAELLRHHEPEQPGLVERLDDDRRQRGVGLGAGRLARRSGRRGPAPVRAASSSTYVQAGERAGCSPSPNSGQFHQPADAHAPPSGCSVVPVMYSARSEARNSAAPPMSS